VYKTSGNLDALVPVWVHHDIKIAEVTPW